MLITRGTKRKTFLQHTIFYKMLQELQHSRIWENGLDPVFWTKTNVNTAHTPAPKIKRWEWVELRKPVFSLFSLKTEKNSLPRSLKRSPGKKVTTASPGPLLRLHQVRRREVRRGGGAVMRIILHVLQRLGAVCRERDARLKCGGQVLSF